jgi:hypothetical protein
VLLPCALGLLALLWASAAGAATVELDQQPVVLGRTESVGVTLRVDEDPRGAGHPLRLAVNVGAFGAVTREAPGVYRSVYIPPETRFPQVALVALWRESGPEAPIGFVTFPLYGTTELPVGVSPGAQVWLTVGGVEHGPFAADRAGEVTIRVDVPPGVTEASIRARNRRGGESTRTVPVRVPGYNRLTAALVPHAIVADGTSWARLVVYYDLGGVEVPASRLRVRASDGEVRFIEASAGRYVYRYQPPRGTSVERAGIEVSVDGDPLASARASLALRLPPPARILVRAPEQALPADGRSRAMVDVLVQDEHGLALRGQPVQVYANGERLEPVEQLADGSYRVSLVAPARYPKGGLVRLVAEVPGPDGVLGDAVNYQLRPAPVPASVRARALLDPIPADGQTVATVLFEVRDAAGQPLEGAQLMAVAADGEVGGVVPAGKGLYRAELVAPNSLSARGVQLRVLDALGGFEQDVGLRLRAPPRRLLAGARGGVVATLDGSAALRLGLDVATPVRAGTVWLIPGLLAEFGRVAQTVVSADESLRSEAEALYVPVGARAGVELWAGERLSVSVGANAGATLAWASYSLTGQRSFAWGAMAGGFASVTNDWDLGQGFAELSFTWAPVRGPDFRLDAGGFGLAVGYRFGVLR